MASLAAPAASEGAERGAVASLVPPPLTEGVAAGGRGLACEGDGSAGGGEPVGACRARAEGELAGRAGPSRAPCPGAGGRRKCGGTSIVKVVGGLCRAGAGPIGSKCDTCRTPRSAGMPAALSGPSGFLGEVSSSVASPGSTFRQGCETMIWPLTGSKRAMRHIFFRGPPTSSQGSQKL